MRRITSLATAGLALLSLFTAAPSAWAQGQGSATGSSAAPSPIWTICFVRGNSIMTDRGARSTVYVSGTVRTVPPISQQEVAQAFGQFIQKKYLSSGLNSSPQCWSGSSMAEAQSAIVQPGTTPTPGKPIDLDCSRFAIQCVMTDWTYTPDPNAAPVASAPPPANPCNTIVDHDLTKRPPGCGPARSVVSPTPPAAPVASAPVNPPPPSQSPQVQNASPTGTVIVRIIHAIDSSHDAVGTTYMEMVAPGNPSIAPGSTASVMLTKTAGGGLTLQLISITTAGRTVAATGGSAAIAATAVRARAIKDKMSASGASVFVPTQTSLSFVLGATP